MDSGTRTRPELRLWLCYILTICLLPAHTCVCVHPLCLNLINGCEMKLEHAKCSEECLAPAWRQVWSFVPKINDSSPWGAPIISLHKPLPQLPPLKTKCKPHVGNARSFTFCIPRPTTLLRVSSSQEENDLPRWANTTLFMAWSNSMSLRDHPKFCPPHPISSVPQVALHLI